jgi:hypothetical protein
MGKDKAGGSYACCGEKHAPFLEADNGIARKAVTLTPVK